MTSTWLQIWERKGRSLEANSLEELIKANGFDTGAGKFSVKDWEAHVVSIMARLSTDPRGRLLEIGCGVGAFLFPLRGRHLEFYGVDYANSMVEVIKKAIPEGHFFRAEAAVLPFNAPEFDFIVAHSVFNYFPELSYAERVITEMARILKPTGLAAILDLNDAAKKDAFISRRKASLGEAEYERLYRDHRQLYFTKDAFQSMARIHGFSVEIFDGVIPGYENSQYRFNAILRWIRGPIGDSQ